MKIFTLVLALACGQAENGIEKKETIVLLGDSLAEGMQSQFSALARKNHYLFSSKTKRGSTIDFWSKNIESIIAAEHPSILIVSLGTNDSFLQDPKSQVGHIQKIKKASIENNIKLAWIMPPELPERAAGKEMIRDIIQKEIRPPDVVVEVAESKNERSPDGIHFTTKGYKLWANSIWGWLVEKLILLPC